MYSIRCKMWGKAVCYPCKAGLTCLYLRLYRIWQHLCCGGRWSYSHSPCSASRLLSAGPTILPACSSSPWLSAVQPTWPSGNISWLLGHLLSVFLQAKEIHSEAILLLRLLWRDGSLYWYQSQPLVFCILLSPRFSLSIFNEQVFKNSELVKIQYNGFSISWGKVFKDGFHSDLKFQYGRNSDNLLGIIDTDHFIYFLFSV